MEAEITNKHAGDQAVCKIPAGIISCELVLIVFDEDCLQRQIGWHGLGHRQITLRARRTRYFVDLDCYITHDILRVRLTSIGTINALF